MNKPVYLALSISQTSKIAMHEFITYDYIKPKYGFECFKKTSTFNEDFIKNYSNISDTGYFFKGDVKYPD